MDFDATNLQCAPEPPHDVRPALLGVSGQRPGSLRRKGSDGAGIGDDIIGREPAHPGLLDPALVRSEEHTSELQSLMRLSYAVFCLKKKTIRLSNHNINKVLDYNYSISNNKHTYINKIKNK